MATIYVVEDDQNIREIESFALKNAGWSYTIISPDDEFEKIFGRKADKRRKLYNGMLKCQAYMYFKR